MDPSAQEPPRPPAAIVFDVDGTLYNQRRLHFAMGRELLWECLQHPRSGLRAVRFLRAYRQAHERLRREPDLVHIGEEQFAMARRRSGISDPHARQTVEFWFAEKPLAYLQRFRYPGVPELLETARSRGVKLGVFSDYPAEPKLDALGIRAYFGAVVCADDEPVRRLKPDPAGLRLCMARLGVEPARTVYVGDRIDVDAECARRAGAFPVILAAAGRRRSGGAPSVPGFKELSRILF